MDDSVQIMGSVFLYTVVGLTVGLGGWEHWSPKGRALYGLLFPLHLLIGSEVKNAGRSRAGNMESAYLQKYGADLRFSRLGRPGYRGWNGASEHGIPLPELRKSLVTPAGSKPGASAVTHQKRRRWRRRAGACAWGSANIGEDGRSDTAVEKGGWPHVAADAAAGRLAGRAMPRPLRLSSLTCRGNAFPSITILNPLFP